MKLPFYLRMNDIHKTNLNLFDVETYSISEECETSIDFEMELGVETLEYDSKETVQAMLYILDSLPMFFRLHDQHNTRVNRAYASAFSVDLFKTKKIKLTLHHDTPAGPYEYQYHFTYPNKKDRQRDIAFLTKKTLLKRIWNYYKPGKREEGDKK